MTDTFERKPSPARPGYHNVALYFAVNNCAKALEFYQRVFGAQVVNRMDEPDGTVLHAEMRIGDSMVELSDPDPAHGITPPPAEGNNFTIMIWTSDVDAVFAKAVEHGATVLSPLADVFSGDRMGVVRCPFGVRWGIGRHDRDIPYQEIAAAAREWMAAQA